MKNVAPMTFTDRCIQSGSDIYDALKLIDKQFYRPYMRQYPDNHVFDADKSVNWNREEVKRCNAQAKAEADAARNAKNESMNNLEAAVLAYIQKQMLTKIDTALAKSILEHAKEMHDSNWWEWLDDCVDFVDNILQYSIKNKI